MSAGIPASELSDDDLERELGQLHQTRHAIFWSGTGDQLANHVARTHELEHAALDRFGERIPEATAKVEALHANEGERRIKGSVTEPLARGGHTEHGWQAEAPKLEDDEADHKGDDEADHKGRGDASGVDDETSAEQGAGASSAGSARGGSDPEGSAEKEQRHPEASSRDGARDEDSVADEQDDAEAMEQGRRA